jgi:predicted naringenin-chalcone synthase
MTFNPLKYDEDEARGTLERALPGGHIVDDGGGLVLSEDALNAYRNAVEARVRDEVAKELETLPTFNDVADWCAHIGRRQAIDVARNGLRKRTR